MNLTVVHVLPGLTIGGAERALVHLVREQLHAGLAVHVVALRRSGPIAVELERAGARVTAPPDARRLVPAEITRLVQSLVNARTTRDVVLHSHLFAADAVALPVARATRAAAVTTLHAVVATYPFDIGGTSTGGTGGAGGAGGAGGTGAARAGIVRGAYHRVARRAAPALYRSFDGVVAVSASVAASFRAFADVNSVVIPPPVVLPTPLPHVVAAARAELELPEGARVALVLGRLVDVKRVDLAVAALKHLPHDVHLVVVGDGPLRSDLERGAFALGVHARTRWLEARPDPETWLALADVVVNTSPHEGFPLVIVEALLSGACVAASRNDGLGDVLMGSPAPAIAAATPEGVAQAVRECLRDDVNAAARAWGPGRARALGVAPAQVHTRLLDVYAAALAR